MYSYKVKIINPNKKSDVAVFYLNDFNGAFDSVTSLRVKLIETFKERDPSTLDFNVGYYEGSQQAKIWLVTTDDLKTFYRKLVGCGVTDDLKMLKVVESEKGRSQILRLVVLLAVEPTGLKMSKM